MSPYPQEILHLPGYGDKRTLFRYAAFTYGGQNVPFFSKCVTYFPCRWANVTNNSHERKKYENIFFQSGDDLSPLGFQPILAVTQLKTVCTHIFENPEFGADQSDDDHCCGISLADSLRRHPHCPPSLRHCLIIVDIFPPPPPLPPTQGGGRRPSSTLSMSMHYHWQGPDAASPPAP